MIVARRVKRRGADLQGYICLSEGLDPYGREGGAKQRAEEEEERWGAEAEAELTGTRDKRSCLSTRR